MSQLVSDDRFEHVGSQLSKPSHWNENDWSNETNSNRLTNSDACENTLSGVYPQSVAKNSHSLLELFRKRFYIRPDPQCETKSNRQTCAENQDSCEPCNQNINLEA